MLAAFASRRRTRRHGMRRHGMRSRGVGALLAIATLAGACTRPQPPSLTPEVVRVAGVDARGVDLDVVLQVRNPNSFALAAESVQGTLFSTRNQKLGEGRSTPNGSIPAEGSSRVASQIHIDWANLTVLAPLLVAERIPYEFRGDVTLGAGGIHLTLPFTLNGELTRTQLLQAGLRGL